MECGDLVKGLPAAFVALVVGVIAAYIAWRQYEASRAKIKLDLFDKRYAIFERTWSFLTKVLMEGAGDELRTDFTNIIPQAGFLFGDDVGKYLSEVSARRNLLRAIDIRTRANGGIVPPDDVERDRELLEWFHTQASSGAKRIFAPYLDFEAWR